ncbi:MAG: hypothetical protein ACI86M_000629 [Saprospiraceae bacterium]|jgi:uncharacterized protein YodC (DUF2158 family)
MVRKFIAGDRVQSKQYSPTMEIIKYLTGQQLFDGKLFSDLNVECVWYEKEELKKDIFNQRKLLK